MINHTIYTMSLDRMSLLIETQDKSLVSRFFLPVTEKAYIKFNQSVDKLFNSGKADEQLNNSNQKIIWFNMITMIEAIIIAAYVDSKPIKEYYLDNYDIKWGGDYKLIQSDLKKYRMLLKEPEKTTVKEEQSFEEIVSGVEKTLGYQIDRSIKLYQFKSQYNLALKIISNATTK